jgi:Protein of unknown function (DUF2764)
MAFYYLTSSLTPLQFGDVPEMGFLSLVEKYNFNFLPGDRQKLKKLRLFFDIENIKRLQSGRSLIPELDQRGNLGKKELKEALDNRLFFPAYVFSFLDQQQSQAEFLANYPKLLSAYFMNEAKEASGFLREYLEFEREWRLVLTAFRAKKQKRNFMKEFAFEDPKDPFVEVILNQKESPYFDAPAGYEDLQEMLLLTKDNPLYQFKHLAEYRFKKLRDMVAEKFFSLDYLLSYALRVVILEDLRSLNEIKGNENLNSILKDIA